MFLVALSEYDQVLVESDNEVQPLKILFRLMKCLYKNYNYHNLDVSIYQMPSSVEACSILLPSLAMVVMRRGKKSVMCAKNEQRCVHWDEGQLHPSHARPISSNVASLPWQELEEELNKLRLTKVSDRN